jgi:hypothetical protein
MSNRERAAVRSELRDIVRGKLPADTPPPARRHHPRPRHPQERDFGVQILPSGIALVDIYIDPVPEDGGPRYRVKRPIHMAHYDALIEKGVDEKTAIRIAAADHSNERGEFRSMVQEAEALALAMLR